MIKKRLQNLLIAIAAMGFAAPVLANPLLPSINLDQMALQIGKSKAATDNIIAGYGEAWQKYYVFTESPFWLKFQQIANAQARGFGQLPYKMIYTTNKDTAEPLLATPVIEKGKVYAEDNFKILQPAEQAVLVSLNSNDETKLRIFQSKENFNSDASAVADYNMDSLLGTITYLDAKQQDAAKKYVENAAMLNLPIDMPEIANPKTLTAEQKKEILMKRSFIATQSAAYSNLYQMYLARKKAPGLAELSGLKEYLNGAEASPMQAQEYAAMRRLRSDIKTPVRILMPDGKGDVAPFPNLTWRESMERASTVMLARENVYLLAEIRYELYQQRVMMERLLAVQSLALIQQNRLLMFFLQTSSQSNSPLNKQ